MLNTECECTLRSTPCLYRISEPEKRPSRWTWRKKAAAAAAAAAKKSLNATTIQLLCLSLEELFFVLGLSIALHVVLKNLNTSTCVRFILSIPPPPPSPPNPIPLFLDKNFTRKLKLKTRK